MKPDYLALFLLKQKERPSVSGARKDQQPGVRLSCTQMTREKKRLEKEQGGVRMGNGVAELPLPPPRSTTASP